MIFLRCLRHPQTLKCYIEIPFISIRASKKKNTLTIFKSQNNLLCSLLGRCIAETLKSIGSVFLQCPLRLRWGNENDRNRVISWDDIDSWFSKFRLGAVKVDFAILLFYWNIFKYQFNSTYFYLVSKYANLKCSTG